MPNFPGDGCPHGMLVLRLRCGALTLQLLLSARRQWQADGHPFEMDAPSQDMTDACRLLGVSPEDIGILHETGEPQ